MTDVAKWESHITHDGGEFSPVNGSVAVAVATAPTFRGEPAAIRFTSRAVFRQPPLFP